MINSNSSNTIILVSNDLRNLKNFRGHFISNLISNNINVKFYCIGDNINYNLKRCNIIQFIYSIIKNLIICLSVILKNQKHVILVYSFPLCLMFSFCNFFINHKNLNTFISGRGRLFNFFTFLQNHNYLFSIIPFNSKNTFVLNKSDYDFFSTKNTRPILFPGEGLTEFGRKPKSLVSFNSLTLGYVGRLEKIKGVNKLLNINKSYKISVYGDGEFMSSLSNCPNITMHGYVEGKENLFSKIDILMFPSFLFEGLPMVIVEAMSFGIPIIWNFQNCTLQNSLLSKTNSIGINFDNVEEVDAAIKKITKDYVSFSESAFLTININYHSSHINYLYKKYLFN